MKSNKTKAIFLAILLTLMTFTSMLVALPTVNAHAPPWTVPTWCYIAVTPDIVGISQQVLVVFWINAIPPTANGQYGDRWQFYLDIIKPDGTKETLGPYTSDPVGGSYCNYVPTEVGNYTLVARFPGQVITGQPIAPANLGQSLIAVNDTYSASTSDPTYFTVGFAYLWSTNVPDKANTWRMFDAFTGNYICDIANVY